MLIIVHQYTLIILGIVFIEISERRTDDINDSVGRAEKKFSFNFTIANIKSSFSSHYNDDKVICI